MCRNTVLKVKAMRLIFYVSKSAKVLDYNVWSNKSKSIWE